MGKKKFRKKWLKLVAIKAGNWIKDTVNDRELLEDICQFALSVVILIIRYDGQPLDDPLLALEKPLRELIDKIDGKEG